MSSVTVSPSCHSVLGPWSWKESQKSPAEQSDPEKWCDFAFELMVSQWREWGLKPAVLTLALSFLKKVMGRKVGEESTDVSLYPNSYRCGLPNASFPRCA